MKRILWLLPILLFLAGCDDGVYSGTLIFEGEHTFGPGTHLPGDVYLRAGTAEFAAGSRVEGSVTVLGGSLTANGEIGGDLVVLDGALVLGPETVVQGDLRLGGGEIERAETAVVAGDVISSGGVELPLEALEAGRSWDDWLRTLSAALLLAGLGVLLVRSRPRPPATVGQTVLDYPLVAGALGLLILLVLPALLVMMAFTIILIPLVIILGLIFLLLLGYGFIAVGHQVGLWLSTLLAARRNQSFSPAAATFWGTLLMMMLFEIPYLGDGLLAITAVLVLGALMLTRLGLRRYRSPLAEAGNVELASYGRPNADQKSS